jgi:uncharacterized Zn-binding protein involved in type VI secretion
MPAARITDMHTCPMVTGLVPHVGGPIIPPCMVTVLIGFLPAARITDMCICVGPLDVIVKGSPTVLIGGLQAARIGDLTAHGGVIVTGYPTVLIGESGSGGGGSGGGAAAGAISPDALAKSLLDSLGEALTGLVETLRELIFGVPPLTEAELVQIRQAKADAKAMLEQTKKNLEAWDDQTKKDAEKWFGDSSEATRQMMLDRTNKQIAHIDTLDDSSFERASGRGRNAYAYVYPDDDSKMYIGKAFWNAPANGPDSKAGTLVHEMSHYNTIGGTDDHAYGRTDAAQLAQIAPDTAKQNADSFEYFVEDNSTHSPPPPPPPATGLP